MIVDGAGRPRRHIRWINKKTRTLLGVRVFYCLEAVRAGRGRRQLAGGTTAWTLAGSAIGAAQKSRASRASPR